MNPIDLWTKRLLEASWLVAIVLVPVHFNIETSRIFEPEKVYLLRAIAMFMTGLWVFRGAALFRARSKSRFWARQRGTLESQGSTHLVSVVILVVALFALSVVISSAVSVAPARSFLGSFHRVQGALTLLSYLVIFFSVTFLVVHRIQIERIFSAIIIGGVSVAIYGILQHFGTDPIPWGGDSIARVSSTMGNSVFVGAYMILALPATVFRIYQAVHPAVDPPSVRMRGSTWIVVAITVATALMAWTVSPRMGTAVSGMIVAAWIAFGPQQGFSQRASLRISLYSVILGIQVILLLFTQSRGPLLGLGLGAVVAIAVYLSGLFRYRTRVLAFSIAVITGALLILSFRFQIVRDTVDDLPYVGRFASAFSNTGTVQVRTLTWEGTTALLTDDWRRTALGYGPETLKLIFPSVYPAALSAGGRRSGMPDRAHNEILDLGIHQGISGLLVYLVLVSLLLYSGLAITGAARNGALKLLCFQAGGIFLGLVMALSLDHSLRLIGVATGAGFLLGFLTYAVIGAHPEIMTQRGRKIAGSVIIFAFVSHFVEVQFGFGITSSYLLFWTWAGLAVALVRNSQLLDPTNDQANGSVKYDQESRTKQGSHRGESEPPSETIAPDITSEADQSKREVLILAWLSGILLIFLFRNFLILQNADLTATGITWLLVLTVVLVGGMAVGTSSEIGIRVTLFFFAVSAGLVGLYYVIWEVTLVQQVPIVRVLLVPASAYLCIAVVSCFVAGGGTMVQPSRRSSFRALWYVPLAVLIAAGVLKGVDAWAVVHTRADMYYAAGQNALKFGASRLVAIRRYRDAIAAVPEEDYYYIALAREWTEEAAADSVGNQRAMFGEAVRIARQAQALSPMDVDHTVNLSRVYDMWAYSEMDSSIRDSLFSIAERYADEAIEMAPFVAQYRANAAAIADRFGDHPRAEDYLLAAVETDPSYYSAYLHLATLLVENDSVQVAFDLLTKAPDDVLNEAEIQSMLAYLAGRIGRPEEAMGYLDRALSLDSSRPDLFRNAVIVALAAGDCTAAERYMQQMKSKGYSTDAAQLDAEIAGQCGNSKDPEIE